jgi:hypothetical protein
VTRAMRGFSFLVVVEQLVSYFHRWYTHTHTHTHTFHQYAHSQPHTRTRTHLAAGVDACGATAICDAKKTHGSRRGPLLYPAVVVPLSTERHVSLCEAVRCFL